jgi:hypothetical protein
VADLSPARRSALAAFLSGRKYSSILNKSDEGEDQVEAPLNIISLNYVYSLYTYFGILLLWETEGPSRSLYDA